MTTNRILKYLPPTDVRLIKLNPRIVIDSCNYYPQIRFYSLNSQISYVCGIATISFPLKLFHRKYFKMIGEKGEDLIRNIFGGTTGIEMIKISPYGIRVKISDAFDWQEDRIEEEIIDSLKFSLSLDRRLSSKAEAQVIRRNCNKCRPKHSQKESGNNNSIIIDPAH